MKKSIITICIIFAIITLHLTVRFAINEKFIKDYNNGLYGNNSMDYLKLINTPQAYIAYYNKGNQYYQNEEYKKAIKEYTEALSKAPKKKICIIRNNLSLSKLALIDLKADDARDKLIEVEEVLLSDNCATEDNTGNNADSQELYNEIEKLLNQQNNNDDQKDDNKDDQKEQQEDNNDDNDEQKEQDLKEQLQEQQQQASEEREENEAQDYEYCDDNCW